MLFRSRTETVQYALRHNKIRRGMRYLHQDHELEDFPDRLPRLFHEKTSDITQVLKSGLEHLVVSVADKAARDVFDRSP